MSDQREKEDLAVFESHRPALVGLAYRMLGDVGRAQDMVQEAWLRWHRREVAVESPKAFLVTIVTRLCLNELDSARARREESRGDRLPEPMSLEEGGLSRVEELEQLSMAILVVWSASPPPSARFSCSTRCSSSPTRRSRSWSRAPPPPAASSSSAPARGSPTAAG